MKRLILKAMLQRGAEVGSIYAQFLAAEIPTVKSYMYKEGETYTASADYPFWFLAAYEKGNRDCQLNVMTGTTYNRIAICEVDTKCMVPQGNNHLYDSDQVYFKINWAGANTPLFTQFKVHNIVVGRGGPTYQQVKKEYETKLGIRFLTKREFVTRFNKLTNNAYVK